MQQHQEDKGPFDAKRLSFRHNSKKQGIASNHMGERGVDVIGTKFLMGDHLYSEGTGLLLAGVAVFVVGFFAFCCIDHCWLKRDLRKTDRWSIFPSDNSNSASDSMYSP